MRFLFWRRKRDEELDAEIQSHLNMAARDHVERGESSKQAQQSARREMGNVGLVKQATRESWGGRWIQDFLQDARYGMRTLRGNPGFTAVAILTLALGIGANTAMFSLVNAVILRQLPAQHPEQLVQVAVTGPSGESSAFSYPAFVRIRDENRSFSGVLVIGSLGSLGASVNGKTESARTQAVSGNFFSLLGVEAAAGRTFSAEEDKAPLVNPVAVISYDYWSRRFRRDPGIIDKQIVLRNTTVTVVGVAARSFSGISVGESPDLYLPMAMAPTFNGTYGLENGRFVWTQIMGRLKPGITREQAVEDLGIAFSHIQKDNLEKWMSNLSPHARESVLAQRVMLLPAGSGLIFGYRKDFANPLVLLMGVAGMVLLIACANVANLLLARSTARRKEFAIKLALGAGPLRLVRQLLTESLLLAFAGGVVGFLVALWAMDGIVALMSFGGASLRFNLDPDFRMLAFAGGVTLLVAIVFGLAPAMRSARLDVTPELKETARDAGPGRSRNTVGGTLVVAQVAISLVLLFGTGLLVRTLINLKSLDPGFDRRNVLLFDVNSKPAGYKGPALKLLHKEILEKLEALPGVRYASTFNLKPLSDTSSMSAPFVPEGYEPGANEDVKVSINFVGPHYFDTLGTPLLRGRDFGAFDTEKSPPAVIINQTMAKYFFGDGDPIGKKLRVYGSAGKDAEPITIIGIVKDAKYETLRERIPRTIYFDALQGDDPNEAFEVKTNGNPSTFAPQIRSAIQSINSAIRVSGFETLSDHVDSTLGHERLMVILCSVFASLAGLLACIGLFGLTSYGVARRRGEIGIRMALGAQRSDILWMVQRSSLRLVFIGMGVGIPSGILASRLISSSLFNLKPSDPVTIAAVSVFMVGISVLAAFLPAWKASRMDPNQALRNE